VKIHGILPAVRVTRTPDAGKTVLAAIFHLAVFAYEPFKILKAYIFSILADLLLSFVGFAHENICLPYTDTTIYGSVYQGCGY